ncbi:phosphocarrier protein HPr /phosphoenolpyruvate--protein phosphotransferase /dihydroxyacetone kinase DhaM subunit [Kribbella sp. VKM Ac-2566]|nr:dihydroxyacetone kinase phosphoryl donor subunit DhaM [Kribbella sp. VKM Ac-2566]TDW81262.1 phosphocarrier protein HPr /phosphoenolpyruvate--protein phosphotransferase /dihydroxyacetone kinase DhaM subunit [Kribbella sp. VKM Ac-2566]
MIGIVVVSHSRALAEAAVGLAAEMVAEDKRPVIAIAAGLDATTFGTDAMAVSEALGTADSPDGVLVLLDLGSAVLSAEMALEFVDPELAARVRLTSAPLVEGLVAAVVTASTDASLDAVAAEAERGLVGKQDHLGVAAADAAPVVEADRTVELVVGNEHGLHARPAARLVGLVNGFDAVVTLTDLDNGKGPVDAGSLSMVATLNAQQGHRLRVGASGPQAAEALAAVEELAKQNFGDDPPEPATVGSRAVGSTPGGSGLDVAIGPAVLAGAQIDLGAYVAGDNELGRLNAALATAGEQLDELRDNHGDIFAAHLALLRDGKVLDDVRTSIAAGASAPAAWRQVYDELAAAFEGLDDAYQRERAQDVRSVRDRVLRLLVGVTEEAPTDGILVVPELDAATAATLDATRIVGIAVRAAGTTGHGVIVARSRGIPLITGIGDVDVPPGAVVSFDARTGSFEVAPDEERVRATITEREGERARAIADADQPATTRDGRTIDVLVNVGVVQDAVDARGADGSGLVRTEVLFGDRRTAPTVDEQVDAFRAIARALGGKPITIRTWDIGGDKPLPFLPQDREANPFLGERGLRVFRRRPELLRDQLEAIRRTAAETPVHVMFPMVTTADEVAWALQELGPRDGLEVGIMVEVPAAALRVGSLATELDFVSIGTNDLTQYTTAADRTNAAVAPLADGLDPAVLQLIDHVVRNAGVRVAVCGDLASDPQAAVLLAALGVSELSAVGPQVPLVKARLRQADLGRVDTAAVLAARDAAQVRGLL